MIVVDYKNLEKTRIRPSLRDWGVAAESSGSSPPWNFVEEFRFRFSLKMISEDSRRCPWQWCKWADEKIGTKVVVDICTREYVSIMITVSASESTSESSIELQRIQRRYEELGWVRGKQKGQMSMKRGPLVWNFLSLPSFDQAGFKKNEKSSKLFIYLILNSWGLQIWVEALAAQVGTDFSKLWEIVFNSSSCWIVFALLVFLLETFVCVCDLY